MKKSFILSLVMVVVLIASLATATYAWYTAQTTVETSQVTVTTAGAADGLLISEALIDNVNFVNQKVNITLSNTAVIEPTAIKAATLPTTATTYAAFDGIKAYLKDDNGTKKASSSGVDSTMLVLANVVNDSADLAGDSTLIYVANPGTGSPEYNVTVTIDNGTVSTGLRVAVFQLANQTVAPANANAANLLGIWVAGSESVGYTNAIAKNEVFNGTKFATETQVAATASAEDVVYASGTAVSCGTAAAGLGSNDVYAIKVWFEGDNIANSDANKNQLFTISFDIVGE